MSARGSLTDRLMLDALAAELASPSVDGQRPGVLLIGVQTCAAVAEANRLAGADRTRLLHLDGAAGALGCGLGNAESLYDVDVSAAAPVGMFGVVGLNVEAARSYRVLRDVAAWAVARVAADGVLLLAGPRNGGAEVVAEAVRPLVGRLDLLTYRKGHRVYRAAPAPGLPRIPRDSLPGSGERLSPGWEAEVSLIELRGHTLHLIQDVRIFARGELDPATRMLAETFVAPPGADLLDLGCGNGALGILAALLDPASHCTLVDADPLAVAAASRGAELSGAANVTVLLSNVLAALPAQMFDMAVMNPPFHRGRREDRSLGEQFMREAAAAVRPGGQLWVVCNRFLPYERLLRQLLGSVYEAAGDRSYKVLTGTR